jgi:hypothetical protein
VLFGLSMILHTVQAIWKKNWWCFTFVVGCISECTSTITLEFDQLTRYSGNIGVGRQSMVLSMSL